MASDVDPNERLWEPGWDGHERAQRERLARLSWEQKLDWLEEAHRFVIRMRSARSSPASDEAPGER